MKKNRFVSWRDEKNIEWLYHVNKDCQFTLSEIHLLYDALNHETGVLRGKRMLFQRSWRIMEHFNEIERRRGLIDKLIGYMHDKRFTVPVSDLTGRVYHLTVPERKFFNRKAKI
jgi:hypothetical protein